MGEEGSCSYYYVPAATASSRACEKSTDSSESGEARSGPYWQSARLTRFFHIPLRDFLNTLLELESRGKPRDERRLIGIRLIAEKNAKRFLIVGIWSTRDANLARAGDFKILVEVKNPLLIKKIEQVGAELQPLLLPELESVIGVDVQRKRRWRAA